MSKKTKKKHKRRRPLLKRLAILLGVFAVLAAGVLTAVHRLDARNNGRWWWEDPRQASSYFRNYLGQSYGDVAEMLRQPTARARAWMQQRRGELEDYFQQARVEPASHDELDQLATQYEYVLTRRTGQEEQVPKPPTISERVAKAMEARPAAAEYAPEVAAASAEKELAPTDVEAIEDTLALSEDEPSDPVSVGDDAPEAEALQEAPPAEAADAAVAEIDASVPPFETPAEELTTTVPVRTEPEAPAEAAPAEVPEAVAEETVQEADPTTDAAVEPADEPVAEAPVAEAPEETADEPVADPVDEPTDEAAEEEPRMVRAPLVAIPREPKGPPVPPAADDELTEARRMLAKGVEVWRESSIALQEHRIKEEQELLVQAIALFDQARKELHRVREEHPDHPDVEPLLLDCNRFMYDCLKRRKLELR
jgi:hypothetical protein